MVASTQRLEATEQGVSEDEDGDFAAELAEARADLRGIGRGAALAVIILTVLATVGETATMAALGGHSTNLSFVMTIVTLLGMIYVLLILEIRAFLRA